MTDWEQGYHNGYVDATADRADPFTAELDDSDYGRGYRDGLLAGAMSVAGGL